MSNSSKSALILLGKAAAGGPRPLKLCENQVIRSLNGPQRRNLVGFNWG